MGDVVEDARAAYGAGAWVDATQLLESCRDELGPDDLERLAIAASLTGRYDVGHDAWERAHHAWMEGGDVPRGVRAAFWLGMSLVRLGQLAPAGGWLARAGRLLEDAGIECAETGRMLLPTAIRLLSPEPQTALAMFEEANTFAIKYGDVEVGTMARLGCGQAHVQLGQVERGVALLDEAMVGVTTDAVNPIAVGIVYCAVISECHRIFDVRRAREWTVELDRWSGAQQGLVPFRGQCLVHRSEMAQLRGDWDDAIDEVTSACSHFADAAGDPALGMALYQRGELHRLRGEYDEADDAYRQGAALGRRDTPGRQLALLGRGKLEEAAASSRLALAEAHGPVQRGRILAAHVEIMVAVDDGAAAHDGVDLLNDLANSFDTLMLRALAGMAAARVQLVDGQPDEALNELEAARRLWLELAVPYEVARTDALIAAAYRMAGDDRRADDVTGRARQTFERLGALPDLRLLYVPASGADRTSDEVPGGLSARELEVIGMVATGMTNRQIAAALFISEKTVARHVSNIFTKLGVNTRTAASSWAHQHGVASA